MHSLQVQRMCADALCHLRSVLGASRQHQAAAILVVRVPLARPALTLRWGGGKALLGWRRRHAGFHAPVASWLLRRGAGDWLTGVASEAARLLGWRGCHSLGATGLLWARGLLSWRAGDALRRGRGHSGFGALIRLGLLSGRTGNALRRRRGHSWLDALIWLGLLSRRAGNALRRGRGHSGFGALIRLGLLGWGAGGCLRLSGRGCRGVGAGALVAQRARLGLRGGRGRHAIIAKGPSSSWGRGCSTWLGACRR